MLLTWELIIRGIQYRYERGTRTTKLLTKRQVAL